MCHDTFKHPVALLCGHSFCKGCLQDWWTQRPTQECPLCKTRTSTSEPLPTNVVLKSLCEKYLEEKRRRASPESLEDVCAAHGEKLKLFCRDDQQLACVMCVCDSQKHYGHRFLSVDEASGRFKETVRESLGSLREKLKVFNRARTICNQAGIHIKVQAQTMVRIFALFKSYHIC